MPQRAAFNYLSQDPTVERWLRFKEPLTKRLYSRTLRHFLEDLTGPQLGIKDPTSLVGWAKARADNLEIQDFIEKFGETQPATARLVRMSTIRSFLKRNGVALPSMGGQRQVQKSFHRGYSREEIQKLLGFLDSYSQKLFVVCCKDSGLRASDVLSLCYRHVKKDLEAGKSFVHLYLEPAYYNRRKASGLCFLGPNSVGLLKQLIHDRKVSTKPDDRIFRFSYPTIAQALLLAKRKAGLDPEIQCSHGLRKFFENSLDKTGLDFDKKRQLEGHSLGVRWAYTDQNVEDLRGLYSKAYAHLDLSEQVAHSKNEALERVLVEYRQRIERLEEENKDLEEQVGDIENLYGKVNGTVLFPMAIGEGDIAATFEREAAKRKMSSQDLVKLMVRDWIAEWERRNRTPTSLKRSASKSTLDR